MQRSHYLAASTAAISLCLAATTAQADGDFADTAIGHAPVGVMGDHMHEAGEIMFSYRFMRMSMSDNRIGNDEVSPETIVTTIPNRFFGAPMQPPTLRIVPLDMTTDMHMLGAMWAPNDWVTLMAMGMYVSKDMDHLVFQGGAGTTRLGEFTTESEGFGDTSLAALVKLYDQGAHHIHLNAGMSFPTGSIDERGRILTPMGGTPEVRLPYAMQIGSGTYDLQPGATYTGHFGETIAWGAQYRATVRLGENDENYTLGDIHEGTAWASYGFSKWFGLSARIRARTQGDIDGRDLNIMGPVQTADPDNYGGDRIDIGGGVNFMVQEGFLKGHRLAVELLVPVYQDLNGPQMESDWMLTIGWQKAFN